MSAEENLNYWQNMSRERQLRFSAYAPTSTQPIQTLRKLEQKQETIIKKFAHSNIPMCAYYCGFRLIPATFYFYTLGQNTFSEFVSFTLRQQQ